MTFIIARALVVSRTAGCPSSSVIPDRFKKLWVALLAALSLLVPRGTET